MSGHESHPSLRATTDAEEITASLEDPTRFEAVVRRHFAEIFRYLASRIGGEGEDLAVETFAIAFRNRGRYDLGRPDARPWLYGIATNLVRHHRRSERRQIDAYRRAARRSYRTGSDEADRATDRIDAATELAKVAAAFRRLDARRRDALFLVGVRGLSYDEAAVALGVKPGTVHSRVARARAELQKQLRDRTGLHGQQSDELFILRERSAGWARR